MTIIRITGLPTEKNVQKQLKILRIYLMKCDVEKFWINEISDTRGTDLKEAGVEVPNDEEAYVLESYLNKVPYRKAGIPYFLKAEVISHDYDECKRSRSRSPYNYNRNNRSRDRSNDRYSARCSQGRYRSRSPMNEPTSQIDMEIEYLRKRRQLVEEERRLITEKKKLEIMKEYGGSVFTDYEHRQRSRDQDMWPDRYKQTETVWQSDWQAPPRPKVSLPQFVMPCKIIMKKLMPIVVKVTPKYSVSNERAFLVRLILANLRKTFALSLEECGYLPTKAIVALYRKTHPTTQDKEFVMKMLEEVHISLWPFRIKEEKAKAPAKAASKGKKKKTPGASTAAAVKKEPQKKLKPIKTEKPSSETQNPVVVNSAEVVEIIEPVEPMSVVKIEDDDGIDAGQIGLTNQAVQNQTNNVIENVNNAAEQALTTDVPVTVNENEGTDNGAQDEPVKSTDQAQSDTADQTVSANVSEPVKSTSIVNTTEAAEDFIPLSTKNTSQIKCVAVDKGDAPSNVNQSGTATEAGVETAVGTNQDAAMVEDDWITNGIDWNDDDDDSKDVQEQ